MAVTVSLIAVSMVWPLDPSHAYWRHFTRPGQSTLAVCLARSTYKLWPVKSIKLHSTDLKKTEQIGFKLKPYSHNHSKTTLFGVLHSFSIHQYVDFDWRYNTAFCPRKWNWLFEMDCTSLRFRVTSLFTSTQTSQTLLIKLRKMHYSHICCHQQSSWQRSWC